MLLDLVDKTRTIRRFDTSKSITGGDLMYILECARRVASAGNLQRLRYMIIDGEEARAAFSEISLGGLLPPEKKPTRDVAPVSYVVISSYDASPDANLLIDVGISAEAVVLSARERGIGACMIRNFKSEYFMGSDGSMPLYPILVIALGYPLEDARIVDVGEDGELKYYKGENGVNIVPKRTLSSLIVQKTTKCKLLL